MTAGHAIEYLSADVAESALRISRILEGSGVPIGVFEYLPDRKKVFCSRTLFELLGLEQTDRDYTSPGRDRLPEDDADPGAWVRAPGCRGFIICEANGRNAISA
ncbi:MAG: hypothetical protein ACLUD2_12840 [Clostridium sp.]